MRISDWSSDVCSSDLRTVKFIEIRLGVLARAQAGYLEHLTRRERFRLDNAPLYEALVRSLAGGDLQSLESQIGEFDRILALETEPRRRRPLMESAGRSRKKWAARWLGVVHSREFQAAWRSEEHTSELQSLMRLSYAVFCLNKNKNTTKTTSITQTDKS